MEREAPPSSSFLFISLQEIKLNLFGCLEFSQCKRTEDLAGRCSSSLLPSLISSSRLFSVVLSLNKIRKFIFYTRPLNTRCWWWHIHGGAFCEYKKFTHGEKVSITASEDEKGRKKREETKSQTAAAAVEGTGALSSLNVVEHKKRCNIFRMLRGDNLCVRERVKRAIKNFSSCLSPSVRMQTTWGLKKSTKSEPVDDSRSDELSYFMGFCR